MISNSETRDALATSMIPAGLARQFGLLCSGLLWWLVLCSASTAAAQGYKVEKVAVAAPQELSAAVRDALAGEALRVIGPGWPLCEIWLRKAVPARSSATQELGIAYGQLAEGTLIGAIRFPADVKDYRRQRVKPGVYTLRYVLLPVDGNHLGVAPQRDFLLAAPAAADASPANVTREEALDLSRKASGTKHPSVWSLPAAEGDPVSLPVLTHQEQEDHWVLKFRVQIQPESAAASAAAMALVVVGNAPEA